MANIMDLISSWKTTVKNNQNISTLYMAYQVDVNCPQKCGFERNETSVLKGTSERLIFSLQTFLFVASLVGTGTIFLMIVGALEVSLGIRNQFKTLCRVLF